MAISTFFEKIVIGREAAEIMAAEAEKADKREPFKPAYDREELERSGKEWLERYRSNRLLARKTK